ncbi:MAG: peptidoglycan-binding protein [Candidatus Vogelbacteria bacterium]|nr:peptidoglycan-binding protein [Candidatus Vogelbacteria bacterium]
MLAQIQAQIAALQGGQTVSTCKLNQDLSVGDGDQGDGLSGQVSFVQQKLIAGGYLNINRPTGWFGKMTVSALKKWQQANSLTATGDVGASDRTVLCGGIIDNPWMACLNKKGVRVYTILECPACEQQANLFGKNWPAVQKIDCGTYPSNISATCTNAGIKGFPAWVFGDGSKLEGSQTFPSILEHSGCAGSCSNNNCGGVDNNKITINSVSGPNSINVGQTGTWVTNVTSPSGINLAYWVNWGDSGPGKGTLNQGSTFTHSYTQTGTFQVSFTVYDQRCLADSTCTNPQIAQTSLTVVVMGNNNVTDGYLQVARDLDHVPTSQNLVGTGDITAVKLTAISGASVIKRFDVYFTEKPWSDFSQLTLIDSNRNVIATKNLSSAGDAVEVIPNSKYFVRFDNLNYPINNSASLIISGTISPTSAGVHGQTVGVSIPDDSIRAENSMGYNRSYGLGTATNVGGTNVSNVTITSSLSNVVPTISNVSLNFCAYGNCTWQANTTGVIGWNYANFSPAGTAPTLNSTVTSVSLEICNPQSGACTNFTNSSGSILNAIFSGYGSGQNANTDAKVLVNSSFQPYVNNNQAQVKVCPTYRNGQKVIGGGCAISPVFTITLP